MTSALALTVRRQDVIRQLKRFSKNRAPIAAFEDKLLNVLWDNLPIYGSDLGNRFIYRARINCPGELFEFVTQMSYPPLGTQTRKNRFNDRGQSIFYGGLGPSEPPLEILSPSMSHPRLYTICTLERASFGTIFTTPIGLYENEVLQFIRPRNALPITYNPVDRISVKYFREEVRKHVNDDDREFYNSTIALGRNRTIVSLAGTPSIALTYPCLKVAGAGMNIAMKPEYVDAHFKIISAKVCCLTMRKTPKGEVRKIPNSLNSATVSDGVSFQWRYTYEEMMTRIRDGLLVADEIVPHDTRNLEVVSATDRE
jgi:hypothetical protein